MGNPFTGRIRTMAAVTLAVAALLSPPVARAAATDAAPFDLAAFRQLAASDRAEGIAQGRRVLDAGVFDADPASERLLLWYMGGAAIGMPDDGALGEVVLRLEGLSASGREPLAVHYAGLLRGARLIDQGHVADGLTRVLEAANVLALAPDRTHRLVASAELCRAYVNAERPAQAQSHCREHTRLAREAGDPVALARAEYLEAGVLSRLDLYEQSVPLWTSARRRFADAGLDALAGRVAGALAGDLVALQRFDEAVAIARESASAAEAAGNPISVLYARVPEADALRGLGRLDEARAVIDTAIAGMDGVDHPGLLASLLETRIAILEAQGADADLLAAQRARLATLDGPEMEAAEQDVVSELERRYRDREQALRIRELETANQATALELARRRDEATAHDRELAAQQRQTGFAAAAALALAIALAVGALLLRAQRRLASSLHQQAYRDALTALPNRRAMLESAQRLLEAPGAAGRGHALAMVDVDHFKAVNDRGGHPFGDRVLAAVAECLQRECGASATVGRFGGEEFVVIAPDLGADAARALAERLRACVAALSLPRGGGSEQVTVSIGLALYDGRDGDGDGLAGWIARADQALYVAKQAGRDRVVAAADAQATAGSSGATPAASASK